MLKFTIEELREARWPEYWLELVERAVGKEFELTLDNYAKLKKLNIMTFYWVLCNPNIWSQTAIIGFIKAAKEIVDEEETAITLELAELCIVAELTR